MAQIVDTPLQISVDRNAAYQRGKTDFNFFAALMLPEVSRYAWPLMYIAMWRLITTRSPELMGEVLRFALGLPRGFAKTTFVKLLICWLIVYDKTKYLLIVAASEPLASNILEDVNEMLQGANAEAVYGKWSPSTDNAREKVTVYHGRKVILYALGALSSVRGVNKDNTRPDFILCDDVQTKENDASEAERTRLKAWLVMTLFKCLPHHGDRVIAYLGNMYSQDCMLYLFSQMSDWISLIAGALLEDGTSIWPELQTAPQIIDSFFHDEAMGLGADWFAEIMNDPTSSEKRLVPDTLPPITRFNPEYGEPYVSGAYITIDPAGYRKNSDDNVIVVHKVIDGVPGIAAMDGGNLNPKKLIERTLEMALEHQVTLIGVESVAYQQTLCFWLEYFLAEANLTNVITVVELKPHGRHKEARIREFVQDWLSGDYTFYCETARNLFIWYARKYKVGETDNRDDYLDAPAYGLDMRREYKHLIGVAQAAAARAALPAEVVQYNTEY